MENTVNRREGMTKCVARKLKSNRKVSTPYPPRLEQILNGNLDQLTNSNLPL